MTVGSGPQSIVVGDFNGDGLTDFAVANVYDSTITVLINDGAGGFASNPSTTYAVGQNPSWIGTADFNHDGILDLAVVNTTSNNITLLQGDGLGGFTPLSGSPFATLSYPVSAVVGDFNADDNADLAVISATGNALSILLNTGTGLAAFGTPYSTGDSPSAIAVSDFNGDGKQDLIVTNGNANTATILFGDGTGFIYYGHKLCRRQPRFSSVSNYRRLRRRRDPGPCDHERGWRINQYPAPTDHAFGYRDPAIGRSSRVPQWRTPSPPPMPETVSTRPAPPRPSPLPAVRLRQPTRSRSLQLYRSSTDK